MHVDKPIVIGITLFVILLLAYFLVYPEYQNFKDLQTDLGVKKAEYTAKFDYYSSISATYAELRSQSENVERIDEALPAEQVLGDLVYYLQEQVTKSGLALKSLYLSKSSNSTVENTVKDMTISLSLAGNYDGLGSLISYLQNSARLFEVESISFGSAGEGTSSGSQSIYSFSMQVKTHTY